MLKYKEVGKFSPPIPHQTKVGVVLPSDFPYGIVIAKFTSLKVPYTNA